MKYTSPLFFLICTCALISCRQNNSLANAKWIAIDSDGIYKYAVEKDHDRQSLTNKVQLQFYGFADSTGAIQKDTVNFLISLFSAEMDSVVNTYKDFTTLRKGDRGYIKVNVKKYYQALLSEIDQFTIYIDDKNSDEELQQDSLILAKMNCFKRILITSNKSALLAYEKENPEWRSFLDQNPLPASIGLSLKKELCTSENVDSIGAILKSRFSQSNVSISKWMFSETMPYQNRDIIYSFTIK